jgi:hypothetical protein
MNLITLGTKELIDLHTPEAKAELERRVSKNGRKCAVKALQNWDGEGEGATIAVNGKMVAPQVGTKEEAIKALLAELGVDVPETAVQVVAPAKVKKENTERIGGVNIQRTVDDNGWTYEIVGVWDGNKVSTDHELAGFKTTGTTDAEAKEAFYAPFKEKNIYLARPYRHPLVDNRSGNALKKAVESIASTENKSALAPAEMTREQLKARLGLPSRSQVRTETMIGMVGDLNMKDEAQKVNDATMTSGIADLMAKFNSLNG